MTTTADSLARLPVGVWQVDTESSELGFRARGLFGLANVKGQFGRFSGALTVTDEHTHGKLTVAAATLDTQNAKRDEHLRSADFFDTAEYPEFEFELTSLKRVRAGELEAAGVLRIRDNELSIHAPVEASVTRNHLTLATRISVDRAAAGFGWNKMGMIKGKAHLHAKVRLTKQI